MTAAFWLFLASAILTVVGGVISVVNLFSDAGAAAIAGNLASTPGALDGELDLDSLVRISQTTAVAIQAFLVVISIAVVLWIAFALRAGRRYIRIVATVLIALQIFATAASPSPLSILSLIVVAAAVILSWLRPSNRYLAQRTALRHEEPAITAVR